MFAFLTHEILSITVETCIIIYIVMGTQCLHLSSMIGASRYLDAANLRCLPHALNSLKIVCPLHFSMHSIILRVCDQFGIQNVPQGRVDSEEVEFGDDKDEEISLDSLTVGLVNRGRRVSVTFSAPGQHDRLVTSEDILRSVSAAQEFEWWRRNGTKVRYHWNGKTKVKGRSRDPEAVRRAAALNGVKSVIIFYLEFPTHSPRVVIQSMNDTELKLAVDHRHLERIYY